MKRYFIGSIGVIVASMAAAYAAEPDIQYDKQETQFERAMREAPERARAEANRPTDKATAIGENTRQDAGLDHNGRLGIDGKFSPKDGPSIGVTGSKDPATKEARGEVNIRIDTDKSSSSRPERSHEPRDGDRGGSHGGDRGGGDRGGNRGGDRDGYTGPDHGDRFSNRV